MKYLGPLGLFNIEPIFDSQDKIKVYLNINMIIISIWPQQLAFSHISQQYHSYTVLIAVIDIINIECV